MATDPRRVDEVQEASEESFPASDPPSYTPTLGTQSSPRERTECYEAVFERAHCRILIEDRTGSAVPTFAAWMAVIDANAGVQHVVVLPSGQRVELHGPTASQALSTALTFLARRFGAPTVYEHHCRDGEPAPGNADPIAVDDE